MSQPNYRESLIKKRDCGNVPLKKEGVMEGEITLFFPLG